MKKSLKTVVLQKMPYQLINFARLTRGEYRKSRSRLIGATSFANEYDLVEGLKRGYLSEVNLRQSISRNLEKPGEASIRWGRAFEYYRCTGDHEDPIRLLWADGPSPGNFGDWLSPYIINKLTGRRIELVDDYRPIDSKYLVAVGSLAPAIKKHAHVLGTGAATRTAQMHPQAIYHSVRGPHTAKILKNLGGPVVENFGDLGFILSKLYSPKIRKVDTEVVLVRHMNHAKLPVNLPEGVMELSIQAAAPEDVEAFVDTIASVGKVVTSAMHCFIACQSYGIPCALVNFEEAPNAVYGDGTKYADTMAGAGLRQQQLNTIPLSYDFRRIESIVFEDAVGEATLAEIARHAKLSLDNF